jgi:hypothetical protein
MIGNKKKDFEKQEKKDEKIDFSKLNVTNYKPGMEFQKGGLYRAPKGTIFRYIDNHLYKGLVKVGEEEVELKEGLFEIKIPKIPYDTVDQIHSFFEMVHDRYQAEAIVLLWHNFKNHEWGIEVPKQEVSGGSADYTRKQKDTAMFESNGYTLVGTVHSHGQMGAFHSGVDDKDEFNFDGVHITIGRINTGPEFACRFIMKDTAYEMKPEECMEMKEVKPRCPKDWLDKVKEYKYEAKQWKQPKITNNLDDPWDNPDSFNPQFKTISEEDRRWMNGDY